MCEGKWGATIHRAARTQCLYRQASGTNYNLQAHTRAHTQPTLTHRTLRHTQCSQAHTRTHHKSTTTHTHKDDDRHLEINTHTDVHVSPTVLTGAACPHTCTPLRHVNTAAAAAARRCCSHTRACWLLLLLLYQLLLPPAVEQVAECNCTCRQLHDLSLHWLHSSIKCFNGTLCHVGLQQGGKKDRQGQ